MFSIKFQFIWESSFRVDFLRNQSIRNKNCLWWPCLFTDQDEMSNLYRTFHRCFLPSFRFNWLSSFREHFQKLTNQKQELPVVAMFANKSGRNEQSLQRTFQPNFSSFGIAFFFLFFQKSTNQKQEWPVAARGPSIDASYQVLIHLAQRFQRRFC